MCTNLVAVKSVLPYAACLVFVAVWKIVFFGGAFFKQGNGESGKVGRLIESDTRKEGVSKRDKAKDM